MNIIIEYKRFHGISNESAKLLPSLKMPVRHIPRYTTCSKNWIRLSCEAPINFTTEYETT